SWANPPYVNGRRTSGALLSISLTSCQSIDYTNRRSTRAMGIAKQAKPGVCAASHRFAAGSMASVKMARRDGSVAQVRRRARPTGAGLAAAPIGFCPW
ncbi:MAG: hypothetical protein ACREDG_02810, partial [Methylocella sp.]